ncbi:hypothetical protein [Geodermatophilus sp. FMUSA9-8]|uniref:hypothetical protein n=1 Tax=Geodermatophilus sp. FMUSA9-8 TaxID=3120155 RepID=UPI00300BDDF2
MSRPTRDRLLRGTARAAAAVACVPLVAAGALAGGLPVLGWGAVLAAMAGLVLVWLHRACGDVLPELPHPVPGAALAGLGPAVVAGAAALREVGGLLTLLLLVLGTAVFSSWLAGEEAGRGGLPTGEAALRRALASAPTDRLLAEWHAVQDRLDEGAPAGLREVRLREALLDAFADRDPGGTARWLAEDPTGPPDPHLARDPSMER